jgi:hypothetical protein
MLYHALCRLASACAQTGDLAAAQPPLDELQALEDAAWPAQRRLWGAETAQVVARMRGDANDTLRLSRRLVALDRARGSDASIALGNLVDHELAAGDVAAAVRTGAALVDTLQGTRNEYSLAFARINLCAAHLAQGDAARARTVAEAAWPQALAFDLQHVAAAYLALLAALEGRAHVAARLSGYSRAIYADRNEAIERNENGALTQARELAIATLGAAAFEQTCREGLTLGDAAIASIAFESDGAAARAQR